MKVTWARSSAVRRGAPVLVLLAAAIAGALGGVELAILTLAAGALLLVITLLWSSVLSLTGESELTFEEALSLGARSVEEEQKRSVLRALKDLEYERSIGKISPEDYAEYAGRYRAEAKRLIQSLDEQLGPARERVERELATRLEARANERAADSEALEEAEGEDGEEPDDREQTTTSSDLRRCDDCEAPNELDARFCKRCGKPLAKDGERLCSACPERYPSDAKRCPACGKAAEEAS